MDAPLLLDLLRMAHVLGAVQGIFLAAVLASRRYNALPNKLLAVLMLAFSVDQAMAVYGASGAYETFPALIGIDVPLTLLYGPVVYLYVRILTSGTQALYRKDLLHGLPFLLVLTAMLPFYFGTGAYKLAFQQTPEAFALGRFLVVATPFKIIQALVYVALTFRLVHRHQKHIRDTPSATEHVSLAWLRNLVVGIIILAGVAVGLYLLDAQNRSTLIGMNPDTLYDDLTLFSTTVFVYAIGYLGLRQPEIFHAPVQGLSIPDVPVPLERVQHAESDPAAQTKAAEPADKPRYAKSGMNPETAQMHMQALAEVMEARKLYRRDDLTLQDLADVLTISPHNLTEVINTQAGQNFYDFVNGYRIREVQERLQDPRSNNLTLLAIGLEAGFKSKSSFNAVFKRHTGMTPSEYRQQVGTEV